MEQAKSFITIAFPTCTMCIPQNLIREAVFVNSKKLQNFRFQYQNEEIPCYNIDRLYTILYQANFLSQESVKKSSNKILLIIDTKDFTKPRISTKYFGLITEYTPCINEIALHNFKDFDSVASKFLLQKGILNCIFTDNRISYKIDINKVLHFLYPEVF